MQNFVAFSEYMNFKETRSQDRKGREEKEFEELMPTLMPNLEELDDRSPYKVRSDNIKSTPQKNFIKEKIIELSKDISTDGDGSLNPERFPGNEATTLKNALEAKYKGTEWFVALFESDEYYSHSSLSTKAFLKADYNEVYWFVANLS